MPVSLSIPPELLPVQEVLGRALQRVETEFDRALRSDLPPLQQLVRHIETYRGKMLRPVLVILSGLASLPEGARPAPASSAAALEEHILPAHLSIAAVCEMIHMATLVHDDVLDDADARRGGATVNRLRGNEAAVILGDYLFSSAYRLCSSLDSQAAALLIGQTGMTLCAGELLQLHHRDNLSIDQPTYFEIVRRKTASLIATACRLGAWQSGASADVCTRFEDFGLRLGVAFQIQDDLLDLTGNESLVGKPLHRDVELGKLTLPVIHHLTTATPAERGRSLAMLNDPTALDAAAADELLARLNTTGSIEFARAKARELVEQAKHAIDPLPPGAPKRMLMLMADQVVSRAF
jgi:octaprenyl-diphosphate synthase